ncbi:GDP-mannose 4,6-dehydratase [Prochlorococcus marinus]|uniref:GDP-mannose 4,6-dehydratase n=1 Tax=Prochlorococcus marinus TaxID=1219 RepID=UPI0016505B75|nr:GDP-mannose 4,6-dehydratase [Prochlorococcus marinus]
MNSKTALVLGCNGQDGSLISLLLLKKGYRVIGFSRNSDNTRNNILKLGIDKDIDFISGDIRNIELISSIISQNKPNEIYNFAAQSSVGKSFEEPIETTQGIIQGTINILESVKNASLESKIFFAGSSEIFGDTEKGADISTVQNPQNPYGISKQTSFNLVKFYRNVHNLKCMTGVMFNHESRLRPQTFVTQKIIRAAKAIKEKNDLKLKLGNIEIIRDWGCASEYMEAVYLMTNAGQIKDHVICTGKATSLKTFISKVFSAYALNWEEHVEIDENLFRATEIMKNFGNPEQLSRDLGWKAKINIDLLINKMIH